MAINEELKEYGADLEKRPQIVVASKMDEEGAKERKEEFDQKLGFPSFPLSSLTHEGVNELLYQIADLVDETPMFPLKGVQEAGMKIYDAHENDSNSFVALKVAKHTFEIKGETLEKRVALINTSTDEGVEQVIKILNSVNVDEKLRLAGAEDGDSVIIGEFEFTYTE